MTSSLEQRIYLLVRVVLRSGWANATKSCCEYDDGSGGAEVRGNSLGKLLCQGTLGKGRPILLQRENLLGASDDM